MFSTGNNYKSVLKTQKRRKKMDIRAFSKLVALSKCLPIYGDSTLQLCHNYIIMQTTGQFRDLPCQYIFGDSDSENENEAVYKLAYSC